VSNSGTVLSGANFSNIGQNGGFQPMNNSVIITGSGSSWSNGYLYLGYMDRGQNQFLINNGGSFVTSSTFDIGVYANSNGCTVADAGSSLQCQTYRMSYMGAANQCIVSNGATLAVLSSGNPTVIEGTFTTATVTGAGSVWTNAGDLDFGQVSNVLAITSGGMMVNNNGYIANNGGKPDTVFVSGTNSLWKNWGDLHVAENGAQLFITNGGMVADNNAYLGDGAAAGFSLCSALVAGAGSLWTNHNSLYVGNGGVTNQLVVTDSGQVVATAVYVYNYGRLVVANAGTLAANNLSLGAIGSPCQMVVSNAGLVTLANNLSASSSMVTNNGGTVKANGISISGSGTLTLNAGLIQANNLAFYSISKFILNGGTLQVGDLAYNNSTPFIAGDGTEAATLQLVNNGTWIFSSGLLVSSNATLTGPGTVNGDITVTNGGTIAPGIDSITNLAVNGNLTLNAGATMMMKLKAVNAPAPSPADSFTGLTNVVYGGTLQLTNLTGNLTGSFYSFKLFSASNYSGAFTSLIPATPPAPAYLHLRWNTNELNVDGVLRVVPAVSPPPVIGSATIASGNFTVSAKGIAYDPCYLLTSTNLATPLSGWTCVTTNYFDATGQTSFTNVISANEAGRYFQLLVN
jgi:T5SS/PEP-CTERM-associated repeat protein